LWTGTGSTPTIPLRALVEVGNDASASVLRKVRFEPSGTEAYGERLCLVFVHPGGPQVMS
jgi:hypothetical protein